MNKSLKLLALFLVSSVFAVFANAETINKEDFLYSIDITVPGYTGTTVLHYFPVLVKLSEETVPNFSYELCKADASDIRFADANGNIIPHEIELWNPEGESYIWVKLPTLSGTNTSFKMYLGLALPIELPENDPTDVWSAYAAVFHGGEKIFDSTGNSPTVVTNSVNGFNTGDNVVAGAMYKPKNSKGVQFLNPVTTGAMSTNNVVSFSGWFKRSSSGTVIVAANKSTWAASGFLAIVEAGTYFSLAVSGTHQGKKNAGALQNGVWGHLAFSYDDTKINSYFNGENIYSNENGLSQIDPGETYWAIGNYADSARDGYVGDMDEIRFYNGVASADWIKAEYDSAISVDTFVSYGKVENLFDYKVSSMSYSFVNDNTVSISYEIDKNYESETSVASVSLLYGRTNDEGLIEKELGTTTGGKYSVTISDLAPGDYTAQIKMSIEKNGKVIDVIFAPISFVITRAFAPTGNYKAITVKIAYDGEPSENIPVLLRLSEENISGFKYEDVIDKHFEIVDINENLLPYEIDTWDEEGESLIWVKVLSLENNAIITVRYGGSFNNDILNSEYVWDDYVGVWHLNETNNASTYGSYPNSTTVAGIDAEKAAVSKADEEGVFGKAVRIVDANMGSTEQTYGGVFIPDSGENSPVDLGSEFSISGWFKHGSQNIYYDHVIYKRLKADNSGTPNNGYAIEVSVNNGTGSKIDPRGSQSGATGTFNLPNSLYEWSYLTFVYAGSSLHTYQNGKLVKTIPITAVKDNNAPIAIGNNVAGYGDALGDCAWNGWVDELRLRPTAPDAAFVAAEYAAMSNKDKFVYSSVSTVDPSQPTIVGYPSCSWTGSSFKFSTTIEAGNGSVFAVYKNLETGVEFTNKLADVTSDMASPIILEEIPELPEGATYSFGTISLSNNGTGSKRVDSQYNIYSGEITIEKLSDASEIINSAGVFRISRDPSSTVGDLTFDVALSGEAIELGAAENIITSVTIPDGASYVDIEINPIPTEAVNEDKTLSITLTGNTISFAGEISAEMSVLNASGNYRTRYVSTTGNDENDGLTIETALKTITAAIEILDKYPQTEINTIYVEDGLYTIDGNIVLTNSTHVFGMGTDPSHVVISNKYQGTNANGERRIFRINNKDALVANLTMRNGSVCGSYVYGGSFLIEANGGTVSNCVVEASTSSQSNAFPGGGYLHNGLVTHTVFRQCRTLSGSPNWEPNRSGVLHAKGDSRVENCLFEDNPQNTTVVLIHMQGNSVMRNCTIADGSLSKTNEYCSTWSALRLSGSAKAENVVITGVTNTIDGAVCLPTGNVANFVNGAVDGDITDLGFPENTIVGTATEFFKNYAAKDYRPRTGGKLAGAGLNYEGMPQYDLSGEQLRLIGANVDIGCYEGFAAGTILFVK